MKRILSIVCAIALALTLVVMPANTQAATAKSVYFTVEKLTIGQGLIVQPTKVEIKDGDTIQNVFEKVMKDTGNEFVADTSWGWYLTTIKKADNGKLNIPAAISKMAPYEDTFNHKTINPPSNDNNTGNANLPDLAAGAYNETSGWMFMLNNKGISEGANKVKVSDGDTIRLHFSVFAYGADVGIGWDPSTNAKLADKDALIKKVADVKNDKEFMSIAAAKKAYDNGIKVLEKYDAADAEVKGAVDDIDKYLAKPDVKVAKAVIKSIKNVKGKKAKITVKKIKGVTGYTFKYSKYKSLKKATKKTTKKTWIKTKKFKKKQTCYARVRAYKVVNNVKYYGKWSKMKKVKIKK